jgi:hypothetical protein
MQTSRDSRASATYIAVAVDAAQADAAPLIRRLLSLQMRRSAIFWSAEYCQHDGWSWWMQQEAGELHVRRD